MSEFKDNAVERDTDHHLNNEARWEEAEGVFSSRSEKEVLHDFFFEWPSKSVAEEMALEVVDIMVNSIIPPPIMTMIRESKVLSECFDDYKAEWCREWLER